MSVLGQLLKPVPSDLHSSLFWHSGANITVGASPITAGAFLSGPMFITHTLLQNIFILYRSGRLEHPHLGDVCNSANKGRVTNIWRMKSGWHCYLSMHMYRLLVVGDWHYWNL